VLPDDEENIFLFAVVESMSSKMAIAYTHKNSIQVFYNESFIKLPKPFHVHFAGNNYCKLNYQ
jgi:hypothetical protein